ncbi:hypothetical protein Bca101_025084 [Brassica carinata]
MLWRRKKKKSDHSSGDYFVQVYARFYRALGDEEVKRLDVKAKCNGNKFSMCTIDFSLVLSGSIPLYTFPKSTEGKKFQVSVEQGATRLLGWDMMQRDNFVEAEDTYRKALSISPDNNNMCNLGICLMKQGRIDEARETSRPDAYNDLGSEMMRRGGDDRVEQRRLLDPMFGSSSIWQPQPYREHSVKPKAKPDLSNGGYSGENVKTNVNADVVVNKPIKGRDKHEEKIVDGEESEDSGLQDIKEFEEAMIMAVLRTETKVLDKKRLKVFQDITSSSLSPRA